MKQTNQPCPSLQGALHSPLFLLACFFYTLAFACRFGISLWSDWSESSLFSMLFQPGRGTTIPFVSFEIDVLSTLGLWLSGLGLASFWWVYAASRKQKPYFSDGGLVILRVLTRLQIIRWSAALFLFLLALSGLAAFSVTTQSDFCQNTASLLIQFFSFSFLESFSLGGLQLFLCLLLLVALGIWFVHMAGTVALFRSIRSILQSIRLERSLSVSFFSALYCMVQPLLTLSLWKAPSLSVTGILSPMQHGFSLLAAIFTGVVLLRLRCTALTTQTHHEEKDPSFALPLHHLLFSEQEQPLEPAVTPQPTEQPALPQQETPDPSPTVCPRCGSSFAAGQHYCFNCGRKIQ